MPIAFAPEIPGKFQWIAANKIRFYPDVLLLPSSDYEVDVLPVIAVPAGYALKGERRFKFHPTYFRVNSASLNFEFFPEKDNQAKLFATVEFNYETDPDQALKKMSRR